MLRSSLTTLIGLIALTMMTGVLRAAEPLVLPLWPDGTAGVGSDADEKATGRAGDKPDRFITNVRHPTLIVYLPPKDRATGAAVVICPGGAYVGVAIDKEGHDVARWLNTLGIAGIVLKYRMPHPDQSQGQKPWPLQDAQRAIRMVRSRASEWGIDSKRVGIMGFSAGGHLASTAGTHFDAGNPDAKDPIGRLGCRPDFMILGYPVITMKSDWAHTGSRDNLLGKAPDDKLRADYSAELNITPETPPAFIVHTKDDPVKVRNSTALKEAMDKAGIPCRLELYDKGGHGYGLGVNGGEVATWPARCAEWLKERKLASAS